MRDGRLKKITIVMAPIIVPWLIRLLGMTLRVTVRDPENIMAAYRKQSVLIAFWHNRIVMMPYFYCKYFKAKIPSKVMISASRDGQLITDVIKRFGIGTFRGSSSKHGIRAIKEITRDIEQQPMHVAMTPDGPRGPVYKVQYGVLYLAASTGLPIVPMTYHLSWKWETKGWDKMPIPIPFGHCELVLGQMLRVKADDDLEVAAEELARRLGR